MAELSDADVGLAPPASPAAAASTKELNDTDVGLAAGQTQEPTIGSTLTAPFVGFNRGLGDIISTPARLANTAANAVLRPNDIAAAASGMVDTSDYQTPAPIQPFDPDIGSKMLPAASAPRSAIERYLQAAGAGVAGMMVPEAGAGALGPALARVAPRAAETMGHLFGTAESIPAATANAAIGATAGAASEGASDLPIPEEWKPAAETIAGLAGGLAGAGATATPELARLGFGKAADYLKPVLGKREAIPDTDVAATPGQQQLAGMRLEAAGAPGELGAAIKNAPGELVPGAAPTLAEQVGIPGVSALQHQVETANNVPFQQAREAQSTARLSALGNMQPMGAPEDVAAAVTQRLGEIDAGSNDIINRAQQAAQGAAGQIGGDAALEQIGSDLRASVADQAATTKAQRRALFQAIDPNGDLNAVVAPVRERISQIADQVNPASVQPSGEEAAIADYASKLPDVAPFQDLQALDQRITAAMSAERRAAGESPIWARLVQMKSATVDAIENAVQHQAAWEQRQVAAGAMNEADTIGGRLQRTGTGPSQGDMFQAAAPIGPSASPEPPDLFDQDAGKEWSKEAAPHAAAGATPNDALEKAAEEREAANANQAGNPPSETASGIVGPGPAGERGAPSGVNGAGAASGSAGAPGARRGPIPNIDAAAAARVAAAKDAYKNEAQTFKQGPVGAILKTTGFSGQYRMLDSSVPARVFAPGASGAEQVGAYLKAGGDRGALDQAVAATLRKTAMNADGTLDPAKFATWQKTYANALRALPGAADAFKTAAGASATVDRLLKMRVDAIKDYQQGVIGKLLKVSDPSDVTKTIGSIFGQRDAVSQMRRLAAMASTPDARAGLRRAIVDHMMNNFVTPTDSIKSNAFQNFMRTNQAPLMQVFKPEEIQTMNMIAQDLARAKVAFDQARLPGQSTTAPDLLRAERKRLEEGKQTSLFSKAWKAALVGAEAGPHAALTAVGAAVGAHILGGMRAAGLKTVDDLVREALLNRTGDGALAKALLAKAPARADIGSGVTLTQQLRRLAILIGAQQIGAARGAVQQSAAP